MSDRGRSGGGRRIAIGAIGLVVVAAACGEPPGAEWCPEPEGVLTVVNRGDGAWGDREPRFEELWRAGGTREGEELAFPLGAAASQEGRVAIADFLLGEVAVIEPDGTWRGPWTRRGEGPGEVRRPVAAAWDGQGRLVVLDLAASRVVYLASGGPTGDDLPVAPEFIAHAVAGGQLSWAGVRPDGTALLILPPTPPAGAAAGSLPVSALLALRPGAGSPDTLARLEAPSLAPARDEPAPGWPRVRAAVAGERLAVGATDGVYMVDIFGPEGAHALRVCRDAEGLPLREDEVGSAAPAGQNFLQDRVRSAPRPASPAPIGRLVLGTGGRLWVERERPSVLAREEAFYGRPGARFDVFDPEGRYLGEVRAPEHARIQAAAGDTLWAFEFGEHDEASLVAYRLVVE